jgi:hypothetical protein
MKPVSGSAIIYHFSSPMRLGLWVCSSIVTSYAAWNQTTLLGVVHLAALFAYPAHDLVALQGLVGKVAGRALGEPRYVPPIPVRNGLAAAP